MMCHTHLEGSPLREQGPHGWRRSHLILRRLHSGHLQVGYHYTMRIEFVFVWCVYRVSCIVVRCLYVVFESVYRRPSTMHRITRRIEGGDGEEHKESNQITDRQSLFYGTTLKYARTCTAQRLPPPLLLRRVRVVRVEHHASPTAPSSPTTSSASCAVPVLTIPATVTRRRAVGTVVIGVRTAAQRERAAPAVGRAAQPGVR